MSTRDVAWPQGTPNWVDLSSPDVAETTAFYRTLFGWEVVDTGAEMGHYGIAMLHGRPVAGIGPTQPGSDAPPTWTTYLAVDDVEKVSEAVSANGGTVVAPPMDVADQGRMAIVQDPSGAYVGLWEARAMIGMGVYNEPGAVVWNEQMSRDPERAKEFYGAVLGYSFEPMEGVPYWTLTPPGASDVVGGLGAIDPGMPAEVPPHWMTYFMVEDVDATVAKVGGAGGTVAQPPFDTPFGRMAIVVDPHGAMFALMSAPSGDASAEG